MTRRLAILASGAGSNAMAVIDHFAHRDGVDVVCVGSDVAHAPVLARVRAREHSRSRRGARIACASFDPASYATKRHYERDLVAWLHSRRVDAVVLAGYMRICGPEFLRSFEGRTINIHPSLLPAFPGLDAVGAALASGVEETGVTIHFVDSGIDTGPVICQASLAVRPHDTAESLHARLQQLEHAMLPICAEALACGQLELRNKAVLIAANVADELSRCGARVPAALRPEGLSQSATTRAKDTIACVVH